MRVAPLENPHSKTGRLAGKTSRKADEMDELLGKIREKTKLEFLESKKGKTLRKKDRQQPDEAPAAKTLVGPAVALPEEKVLLTPHPEIGGVQGGEYPWHPHHRRIRGSQNTRGGHDRVLHRLRLFNSGRHSGRCGTPGLRREPARWLQGNLARWIAVCRGREECVSRRRR